MGNPWTPGPWEQRTLMVMANNGRDCVVHCGGTLKPIPQRVCEMEANARLIAEAPAMAEVLEAFVYGAEMGGHMYDPLVVRANAILARIKGEPA